MHNFVSLHNLDNLPCVLARVIVRVRFGSGLEFGLGQKFASCKCVISKFAWFILQIAQIGKSHAMIPLLC